MMLDPAAFVEGFRRFWAAPSMDGFAALLAPDVTLVQPLAPPMRGLAEVQREFRAIFRWMPDIGATVDRWSATDNVVFIEFRLHGTIGRRRFEWPVVDRFVLREDGLASERVTYFDSLPLFIATARRPSGWRRLWTSGAASAVFRSRRRSSR